MQTDNKEKTLFRLRTLALMSFYTMLVGGIAMIGLGTATHLIQFLIDGAIILVVSPIFIVMSLLAKEQQKKLDVLKSGV